MLIPKQRAFASRRECVARNLRSQPLIIVNWQRAWPSWRSSIRSGDWRRVDHARRHSDVRPNV